MVGGKMGEESKNVQTSKSWGYNVQHGYYSY